MKVLVTSDFHGSLEASQKTALKAMSKIDALKEIIRAWGMNPEEILTRQALTEPHRTVIDRNQMEQSQIQQLSIALKQQLLKELRENPNEKTV